jgi:exonuclease SbcD
VRVLHTSDWHLTKTIARRDRTEEFEAVLDEVVTIADEQEVDLVVHSGDLFDRAIPPPEAIRLALVTLVRLTGAGKREVVVVAGNHDSPRLFEALRPVLLPLGIHLVGDLRPPGAGGAVIVETDVGTAVVCCVPYVTQGRVVDFMDDPGRTYSTYAERMQAIIRPHHAFAAAQPNAVTILASHFMVGGVKVRGGQGPTGMKELSIGEAYAASEAAVNHDFSYVALGHIHLPQRVPGAPSGEYAGSLLQLDFGEAGEEKRVVVVDAEPGRPASTSSIALTSGRQLIQARGTWKALTARGDLSDAWLDLTIETDAPPTQSTIDEWKGQFPRAVKLHAAYPTDERADRIRVSGRELDEVYAEYVGTVDGSDTYGLVGLFRDVLTEARE